MNPRQYFLPLLLVPFLAVPLTLHAAPLYTVASFGANNHVAGINNSGQVAGTAYSGNVLTAFVSSGGGMTMFHPPGDLGVHARAINDAGAVLAMHTEGNGSSVRSLIFSGSTVTDLGFMSSSPYTFATAINNSGQVTGDSGHAFLYQPGSGMVDLGTLGGPGSSGSAINNAGTVVGAANRDSGGTVHAFMYSGGVMRELGSLGGRDSEATAVNDSDVAVGWASKPGDHLTRRAVLFANGTVTELGSLVPDSYSQAYDINNLGEIVGSSGRGSEGAHGFLYTGGTMVDLNSLIDPTSGWVVLGAIAINDHHQILAMASDLAGRAQSVVLTLAVSPVPEPGRYSSLLFGLALLGVCFRSKRKARAV
jgi:probable HAF family extracellular repeat protein